MGYYEDVYLKRLNRYGIDFQSRMQRQREENFKLQLMRSVYYVNFDYEGEEREGELTPYKQNETISTYLEHILVHGTQRPKPSD